MFSPAFPGAVPEQVRLKGNIAFRCSDDIRAGVSNLLIYVKSMKGLAGIRDAVWELLSSESISQHWEAVCRRLLDKPASFWEDLLQQLFLDRLEVSALPWQLIVSLAMCPLLVSNGPLVPVSSTKCVFLVLGGSRHTQKVLFFLPHSFPDTDQRRV